MYYNKYKKIGVIAVFAITFIVLSFQVKSQGSNFTGLESCRITLGGCSAGPPNNEIELFKISELENAHVGSKYPYSVCCKETDIGTIGTSCLVPEHDVLFNVSDTFDGHVSIAGDIIQYNNNLCLSTTGGLPVDCNYISGINVSCAADYTCIVTLSETIGEGRHVADCFNSTYNTQLCCAAGDFTTTITTTILFNATTSIPSTEPGVCGDGVVNFGEQCDSNLLVDPQCQQTVGFNSCDQNGLVTNIPCTCYTSTPGVGIETVEYTTDCQDDGDGDTKGLRQITTEVRNLGTGTVTEVNEQRECDLPPINVPVFGIVNLIMAVMLLTIYYLKKRGNSFNVENT